ncbi:enoyl-CoA hydratase [Litchfieldia alkalitelluris]|uniref:enoyl-CoA hydratase n=1 Tax=Litchfieldia alkalitelluris TaxID=304268 RepID=UPI0009986F81|nr:enoyl-CoA hydratase [Litchfieldia alkalitelluris]
MNNSVLSISLNKGIKLITLNRSNAANALSLQLLKELNSLLDVFRGNKSIRCIIITGTGNKAFCAGADLKERLNMDINETRAAVELIRETLNKVEDMPQPVIAAINGVAFGGGTELALACDIRIASDKAKLGLTETSLGIIPGAGGTQRLPRLIGKGKAKELIFTAKKVDAHEALEIGLVEYVTSEELLLTKAIELAEQIAINAPIANQQAKLAINKGSEVDLPTGLSIEKTAYEGTIYTKDRLEGLTSFKEKRPPIFIGE